MRFPPSSPSAVIVFIVCTCCSGGDANVPGDMDASSATDTGGDAADSIDDGAADAPDAPDVPPACEAAVGVAFESILFTPRGSDLYAPPERERRDALRSALEACGAGGTGCLELTAAAEYDVCTTADVYLFTPQHEERGDARIALRASPARDVILEAPHPVFDSSTAAEALLLFEELGARALIVSGTHRCASSETSACDGSTSVCSDDGGSAPFRRSDMAHVVDSTFQVAHEALADRFTSALVVSVHGMGGDGASVSDGTVEPIDDDATIAAIARALRERFPGEPITVCSPGASGLDVEERLCGRTNAQGRHVNGSTDACLEGADASTGRFVHLEQSRTLRDAAGLVAEALAEVVEAR